MADQSPASNERLIARARAWSKRHRATIPGAADWVDVLADALAQAVPEGWRLVPVEPDQLMLEAMIASLGSDDLRGPVEVALDCWEAGFRSCESAEAAAPSPPVLSDAGEGK